MPTFQDVLAEEKKNVSTTATPSVLHARTATADVTADESYGLAFSGGGIRSATFNLGILQGLAQAKLLPQMKYISTVSGGGYIGAWLVSWIKRAPRGLVEDQPIGRAVPTAHLLGDKVHHGAPIDVDRAAIAVSVG